MRKNSGNFSYFKQKITVYKTSSKANLFSILCESVKNLINTGSHIHFQKKFPYF